MAKVLLRNPTTADTIPDVLMLIDSGADVTLVPEMLANQLGLRAKADETYELVGFDGNISFASVVHLEMFFLNKTFRGRFLLINQEWGVPGRDVLNHIAPILDGPHLIWDERHHH